MRRRWNLWRTVLVLAIVGGLLSTAGLAFAQSSQLFDLGCWGTVTSGGGERQSGSFTVRDATGQVAVGQSQSGQFTLRSGVVQDWSNSQTAGAFMPAAASVVPAEAAEDGVIFLPIIQNFVRSVRTCNY
jgi:hypothetical protein